MPFTMSSLVGLDDRPPTRKSTSSTIINACSATMSPGTRSTISDAFQIFQFFRGDVGYGRIFESSVPKFTFKTLLYALNEILIGNARKSQLVPPLISQLFYVSLEILTKPEGKFITSNNCLTFHSTLNVLIHGEMVIIRG